MPAQDWTRTHKGKSRSDEANSIPISPIVSYFGGEVREGREVAVRCVMHTDSRRSASMNTDKNLYYCQTCGKGGNAVNLVCIIENLEFKDGLKRAIEIAAGSGIAIRSSGKSRGASRPRRTWDI
jgi:DNA primase